MANPDATGTPSPPPSLRVSADEDRECDNCKMFVTRKGTQQPFDGHCTGYSLLPVCGEWVCDSWAEGEKEPTDLREAGSMVRAHFRRRRNAPAEEQET